MCKSADAIDEAEPDVSRVGEEVLNAFNGPTLPLHELQLKPLMPIMLLRNLDPVNGLCNGTRLLVIDVTNMRVLRAMILAGAHAGRIVAIPRIRLWAEEGEFPFKWSRRQFPVRVGALRKTMRTHRLCVCVARHCSPFRCRFAWCSLCHDYQQVARPDARTGWRVLAHTVLLARPAVRCRVAGWASRSPPIRRSIHARLGGHTALHYQERRVRGGVDECIEYSLCNAARIYSLSNHLTFYYAPHSIDTFHANSSLFVLNEFVTSWSTRDTVSSTPIVISRAVLVRHFTTHCTASL